MQSIYDFNYFCCPECVYQSKEELLFQEHALQKHEQSKSFFQNSNNISYGNEEDTFSENHNFDEYIIVEPNTYCKSEVNSDPITTENYEPLKEIKTELISTDNDIKHYYEKISEDGGNYESSGDYVENKQMSAKKKRKKATEENPNKFQCQFCPQLTMQKLSLRKHITRYHSDEYQDDEICTEEIETKDYLCSRCNESFNDLLKVWFTIKSKGKTWVGCFYPQIFNY